MTDADLYALCIWTEARGEMYEGKVAVARVIANRMAQRYESDGTIAGTVLAPNQFSDFYFTMVNGHYTRVAHTVADAAARAEKLLTQALCDDTWPQCQQAVQDGAIGSDFAWGPQGRKLNAEPRALLYDNMAISHPYWASPETEICTIEHHTFFRA